MHDTLQSMGAKKIVMVGYMAHVCVSTTAREAFQKDYEVVLVEDAIGDRDIPGESGVGRTGRCFRHSCKEFGYKIGWEKSIMSQLDHVITQ